MYDWVRYLLSVFSILSSVLHSFMGYLDDLSRLGRDANPFFSLMDIDVVSYGQGEANLIMPVRDDMKNGEGWLQGGLYTALADEAMALAVYTLLSENETIATISATTTFMKGVRNGLLDAEARVIKRGRSVIFAEASVRGEDTKEEDKGGRCQGNGRDERARCSASFMVRNTNVLPARNVLVSSPPGAPE